MNANLPLHSVYSLQPHLQRAGVEYTVLAFVYNVLLRLLVYLFLVNRIH